MTDKFIFVPRVVAEQMTPSENSVIISFYDKSEAPANLNGWKDILRIRCHDTDGTLMGLEVFDAKMANQISDFAKKHFPHVDHFYVHCQLGQSRSGATALALSEFFQVPCFKQSLLVDTFGYPIYNKLVYSKVLYALHGIEEYS